MSNHNEELKVSADLQLFAEQKKIYPKAISGAYRFRKWLIVLLGLAVYYLTPFLRYDRGPYAPDQAVFIDMVNRRAYWFFIEIWPQEVYYFAGILIIAAFAMFFVTSLFGRVWCGYLCFQTVWTDLFMWVERVVQGDRNARIRLDQAPWTLSKIAKKAITHVGWLLISLFTAGAFVLYFNDAPTLIGQIFTAQVSSTVLLFIGGLTLSTYIMAGFAREQVCTFMCPYARFQSAMFDDESLIIAYDAKRGEPRGKYKQGESWDDRGQCIDCTQCVQVCPMGIDIRNGLQIECIACGLCIDACDGVMDKLERPRGLIRYDTERNMRDQPKGAIVTKASHMHLVRPRTALYAFVLSVVLGVFAYGLLTRSSLELHVSHDRNPLYVTLSDGAIRNGYEVNVLNKTLQPRRYTLSFAGVDGAQVSVRGVGGVELSSLDVPANDTLKFRVFVHAPDPKVMRSTVTFTLKPEDGKEVAETQSIFLSKGE